MVNVKINSKHIFPLLIKVVLNFSWLNKKTKMFIKYNGIVVNKMINKNSCIARFGMIIIFLSRLLQ
jgi:hypothetical protein